MSKRIALITGITGQDASYLSELLLEKDYKIYGIKRRSSTNTMWRIQHLLNEPNFHVVEGDVTDPSSINCIIGKIKPDEIYSLAAMSHVHTSFEQPSYTFNVNANGPLYILEAVRNLSPKSRIYQASTSELMGSNYDIDEQGNKYQDENTALKPNSPYALAKLCAHGLMSVYARSYNIFSCSGILFNHETLSYGCPIIVKKDGIIDILPIGDVARFLTGCIFDLEKNIYQAGEPINNLEVWDRNGWTKVKYVSGYKHNFDKNPRIINSRNFVYTATDNHICFMDDGIEKSTKDINIGDKIKLIEYPNNIQDNNISLEYAEFLGMMVGDGNLIRNVPRFTNKDINIKEKFGKLWLVVGGPNARYELKNTKSGFTNENIGQVYCYGGDKIIDYDIYTNEIDCFGHKTKKIPKCVLNGSRDIMEAFLVGYNICDGLKVGRGNYRFKNFKTNSMTLAAGLVFLINKVTGQKYNITVEESWKWGKQQFYYSINLLSDNINPVDKYDIVIKLLQKGISQREIYRQTKISRSFIRKIKNGYRPSNTRFLELSNIEVKKIIDIPQYNGWFFDLETESGTFSAGIGPGLLHNSPRRGEEFVTRKITQWIGKFDKWRNQEFATIGRIIKPDDGIYFGIPKNGPEFFPKLRLGNIDSYRDWGHAKDFVRAMWMILQQEKPDNFVIATGKAYTVAQFCELAFAQIGITNWRDYIYIDPELYRPCEVEYLCGRPNKAKKVLGWEPKIMFEELVKEMVQADIERECK